MGPSLELRRRPCHRRLADGGRTARRRRRHRRPRRGGVGRRATRTASSPGSRDSELAALDRRERDYDRVDVTSTSVRPGAAVGPARAHRHLRAATVSDRRATSRPRDAGQAGIRGSYWGLVDAAFAVLGRDRLQRYRASTPDPDIPVVALIDATAGLKPDPCNARSAAIWATALRWIRNAHSRAGAGLASPRPCTTTDNEVDAVLNALGILAVVVLIAANGYFVAGEFAFVAARRSKFSETAATDRKSRRARRRPQAAQLHALRGPARHHGHHAGARFHRRAGDRRH